MSAGAQIDYTSLLGPMGQNPSAVSDFQALDPAEKQKVLLHINNDYAALPPQEQAKALDTIQYGPEGTKFEQERAAHTGPNAPGSTLGRWLTGAATIANPALGAMMEAIGPTNVGSAIEAAPGVVARQAEGIAQQVARPITELAGGYNQARAGGAGPLAAGAYGGLRSLAAVEDPLGVDESIANLPSEYARERQAGRSKTYSALAPAGAMVTGVNLPRMETAADTGNVGGVLAEAAVPAGEVAGAEVARVPAVREAGARAIAPVMKAVRAPLETFAPRLAVPEAPQALHQALSPGVSIPKFREAMEIAGPRLQQLKQDGMIRTPAGEPVTELKGPEDLKYGSPAMMAAKRYVYSAIEDRMGPVAALKQDMTPVAKAIDESIADRTARLDPAQATELRDQADFYRKTPQDFQWIENEIQALNQELKGYYKSAIPGDKIALHARGHCSATNHKPFLPLPDRMPLTEDDWI